MRALRPAERDPDWRSCRRRACRRRGPVPGRLSRTIGELLAEPLGALAQRVERLALAADRGAGLALAELAFGAAHGLAGLAELAGRIEAHALELLHQLAEALLERLLLLLQILQRLFHLLLGHRLAAAVRVLALVGAVGPVHQLFLPADHVAELIEALHGLVVLLSALLRTGRPAGSPACSAARRASGGRRRGRRCAPGSRSGRACAAGPASAASGHWRRAAGCSPAGSCAPRSASACRNWFIAWRRSSVSLLDLVVGGVVLERLAQRLLGVAQRLGGERQVAVLDAERDLPEIVDHAPQFVVAAGVHQAEIGGAQRQVIAGAVDPCRGPRRARRAQSATRSAALASSARRARCSTTARASGLLKLREGSVNSTGALRPSCLASSVATSVSLTLAPAHGCEVRSRMVWPVAVAHPELGQRQRQRRRVVERARIAGGGIGQRRDLAARGDDAIVVVAANRRARARRWPRLRGSPVSAICGGLSGVDDEGPSGDRVAGFLDGDAAGPGQRHLMFQRRGGIAGRGRCLAAAGGDWCRSCHHRTPSRRGRGRRRCAR